MIIQTRYSMKKTISVLLAVAMCLFLVACAGEQKTTQTTGKAEQTQVANTAETNVQNKGQSAITFYGSTTLAPVVSKIATNFTEEFEKWNKVDSSLPEENIAVFVASAGSGAGVKAVIDNTADFGMLAREVKDEEKQKIKDYQEYKLGLDALTISVNPESPLLQVKDDITKEELKKIFSGEYKTWKEFDASLPAEDIVLVIRDLGGGAHEVFQKKVMGETEVAANAIQAPSMGALVQKVIENKNAIGYASFGMVRQHQDELKPLKVEGVEPTAENILSGAYDISRPLVVVGSGELTGSKAKFMEYLQSAEGTKVIEDMGFIANK